MVHDGFDALGPRRFGVGDGRVGVGYIGGWKERGGRAVSKRDETDRERQQDELTDERNFGVGGISVSSPAKIGHDVGEGLKDENCGEEVGEEVGDGGEEGTCRWCCE